MLWTEKYRPSKLSDIVGQESFKLDAENWIEINDMPNILLFGSQQGKIGDVPFKICLLDEMDGMTIDAQNALKRIMERYANNIRFIITCNDRSKIIYPIQSRCANYFFEIINDDIIYSVISKILTLEGQTPPLQDELEAFICSYNGDLRRVITELQAAIASKRPLQLQVSKSLESYNKALSLVLDKQWDESRDMLFKMIRAGKTVKDICIGLHDVVILTELDYTVKFKLLRVIGETEWRSQTMTPRILVSWMMAQMK